MSLLTIKNLSCGYAGGNKVIDDISFTVLPGEVVGIIGPNGAGKTTLFRVLTRLLKPWRGEIRYHGRDVQQFTVRELARSIAVLPQNLPLTFSFTIKDFILMGRLPHLARWQNIDQSDLKIADEMMRLTEINHVATRYVTELSGGELQRVILAQALTQQPELVLLDEPTSHLDIGHQVAIMDLVRKLNKEHNLTVLMVLHDLNLAGLYCDRLILLSKGKIHSMGTPREVLTYQNIESVYKTLVVVKDNPLTNRPYVFLVPKERWKSSSE